MAIYAGRACIMYFRFIGDKTAPGVVDRLVDAVSLEDAVKRVATVDSEPSWRITVSH